MTGLLGALASGRVQCCAEATQAIPKRLGDGSRAMGGLRKAAHWVHSVLQVPEELSANTAYESFSRLLKSRIQRNGNRQHKQQIHPVG